MPNCSILQCKNNSRTRNLNNGDVSYHRFPINPHMKEKWIDATGRVDWMPTKSSTICSKHFLENDFIISKKGLRYTKPTAIPSLRIIRFVDQQQNPNYADDSFHLTPKKELSEEQEQDVPSCSFVQPLKPQPIQFKTTNENFATSGSSFEDPLKLNTLDEFLLPRKNKLRCRLRFCEDKLKRQSLKIKRLQAANRRLKKKIFKIDEILASVENNYLMTRENVDCLKNTNLKVRELIARVVQNTVANICNDI